MAWFSQQTQVRPYNYRNAPSTAANPGMNFSENVATGPKEYPYNQQQFGMFTKGKKTGRQFMSPMSSTQMGQFSTPAFPGFPSFATPLNDPRRTFYKSQNYNVKRAKNQVVQGMNNPMSWGSTPQSRASYIQSQVSPQRAFNPNNYIMSNVRGGKSRKATKKHKKRSKSKTRKH